MGGSLPGPCWGRAYVLTVFFVSIVIGVALMSAPSSVSTVEDEEALKVLSLLDWQDDGHKPTSARTSIFDALKTEDEIDDDEVAVPNAGTALGKEAMARILQQVGSEASLDNEPEADEDADAPEGPAEDLDEVLAAVFQDIARAKQESALRPVPAGPGEPLVVGEARAVPPAARAPVGTLEVSLAALQRWNDDCRLLQEAQEAQDREEGDPAQ